MGKFIGDIKNRISLSLNFRSQEINKDQRSLK